MRDRSSLEPIVQVARRGVLVDPAAVIRARAAFERDHWVRLPALLEASIVELFQRLAGDAPYRPDTHAGGCDRRIADESITGRLMFLVSDRQLFEAVEEITGCAGIASFLGRIYRVDPGGEEPRWHDDATGGRLVAMSVNLSRGAYAGGLLQIRDAASKKLLAESANPRPGDAALFRLHSSLEHRITAISGSVPRVAFAGWFLSHERGVV